MVIGAAGKAITIGNNAADPYGLVIGGTVRAAGVYDMQTTPHLPGPVSATALQLGDGGTVDLTGGVHVTGSVSATALNAAATGDQHRRRHHGGDAGQRRHDQPRASPPRRRRPRSAITIAAGANVGSIINTGIIAAAITDTKPPPAARPARSSTSRARSPRSPTPARSARR